MAVKIISGIPGSGKTLYSVNLGYKHFKSENSIITKFFRIILLYKDNFKIFLINVLRFLFNKIFKKHIIDYKSYKINVYKKYMYNDKNKINNVYSNFPILLDNKRKIYSNQISLWDLNNDYSFLPYSLIIIDEIQLYIDSDQYKDFPSNIAKFNQAHRHYGIKDIVYISQHPSRVVKKLRNLTNEFWRIKFFCQIPLLKYIPIFKNIGIFFSIIYYEFDFYGQSIKQDKKFIPFDFKRKIGIYNIIKLYNKYDTCYLKQNNLDKPVLYNNEYKYLDLTKDDLESIFPSNRGIF